MDFLNQQVRNTSYYADTMRKLNWTKREYVPFSGELVDEYGNKNSYYFEQFEKDLEYINSLDSYQFLEWLEKAETVTIDNYLNYIEYINLEENHNWLKRFLNFIGAQVNI
jgi:hypothetical protein